MCTYQTEKHIIFLLFNTATRQKPSQKHVVIVLQKNKRKIIELKKYMYIDCEKKKNQNYLYSDESLVLLLEITLHSKSNTFPHKKIVLFSFHFWVILYTQVSKISVFFFLPAYSWFHNITGRGTQICQYTFFHSFVFHAGSAFWICFRKRNRSENWW